MVSTAVNADMKQIKFEYTYLVKGRAQRNGASCSRHVFVDPTRDYCARVFFRVQHSRCARLYRRLMAASCPGRSAQAKTTIRAKDNISTRLNELKGNHGKDQQTRKREGREQEMERTRSSCRQANSSREVTGKRSITGRDILFIEDSIISAPY